MSTLFCLQSYRHCTLATMLLVISVVSACAQEWRGAESEAELLGSLRKGFLDTRIEITDAGRTIAERFGKDAESFLIKVVAEARGGGGTSEGRIATGVGRWGVDIAYLALGAIGTESSVEFLVQEARQGRSMTPVRAIMEAPAFLARPAMEMLIDPRRQPLPSTEVRIRAAQFLGVVGTKETLPLVRSALDSAPAGELNRSLQLCLANLRYKLEELGDSDRALDETLHRIFVLALLDRDYLVMPRMNVGSLGVASRYVFRHINELGHVPDRLLLRRLSTQIATEDEVLLAACLCSWIGRVSALPIIEQLHARASSFTPSDAESLLSACVVRLRFWPVLEKRIGRSPDPEEFLDRLSQEHSTMTEFEANGYQIGREDAMKCAKNEVERLRWKRDLEYLEILRGLGRIVPNPPGFSNQHIELTPEEREQLRKEGFEIP